jgi:hypothetical protein
MNDRDQRIVTSERGALVPGGTSMVVRRVILRLLAAGGDVRPIVDVRGAQASARVSLIAPDQEGDALDGVDGCEYVDDRIRLRE